MNQKRQYLNIRSIIPQPNEKRGLSTLSKQVQPILDSGSEVSVTAMVCRCGLMVLAMRDSGVTTARMVMESSFTSMETSTKAIGSMTKPTGTALTFTSTVQGMKVSGRTTCSTDRARRHGLMDQSMRANILQERNMASESIRGTTALAMRVNGSKIR